MRLALYLCALLAFPGHAQEAYQAFPFPLFKEGLHTRYSANAIPDGSLSEALNVVLDEDVDGVVVARNGYSKYNTTAVENSKKIRGLWPFDAADGTKYLVAFSSASFYKSTGDGVWTAITGLNSFSLVNEFDCVQSIGKLFCANGDVVFSWNGTSTAVVSGAPIGNLTGKFRNRLLLAGISGSKARLRGSGELDETDWTVQIPGVSTTPFNIAFGGADDGEDITCLMGAYQDVFLVGKRNSLWGLYGFGRTDFSVREISREVGCIEQRSVKEKNNCLYWMSLRGIEKFCGATITRAGDPIRDQIDTIIAAVGNARSSIDTTQADFESGNLTASGTGYPLNATISPGNVIPSTSIVTDTSGADFAAGTLVDVTTRGASGSVIIYQGSTATFINAGGESSGAEDYVNWNNMGSGANAWGQNGSGCFGGTAFVNNNTQPADPCGSVSFVIISTTGVGLSTTTISVTDGVGCTYGNINLRDLNQNMVRVQVRESVRGTIAVSSPFVIGNSLNVAAGDGNTGGAGSCSMQFDISETTSWNPTATFTSQYLLRPFDSPLPGSFDVDMASSSASAITFQVQASTANNGGALSSLTSQTPGANFQGPARPYARYQAAFTIDAATRTPAELKMVELNSAATGYFISDCANPGTGITSWGNFSCTQDLDGGSLTYYVSTGASCNIVTRATATWNLQSNNTPISIATAPFVAYRALFDLDVATDSPKIRDCTINWREGESRPPVASQVYRDRYYLAYTSSTESTAKNDHLLVLDKNDKWTLFDNHKCYSLALYNRKLHCGSSTEAGQVWLLDSGSDDDGTAINSRIRTKAFNLGLPERPKKFWKMYLDLEPSPDPTQTISLTGSYLFERSTTTYSLGSVDLNEDPGSIMTSKFPFSLDNPISGRYIQVQLQSSGLNSPWRLFGGRLYYLPLDPE